MSFHRLYIDTDRSLPVAGVSDSSVVDLPAFVQEDSLNLRITLLAGFSRVSDFTPIPVSGITLEVALGRKIGNTSTLYTQQFTWTASDDLADPYFEATLPMNTGAIATLLGANAQADAYFEVKMLDGGLPRTVLSRLVKVQAAVIKDGGLEEPALPTPISAETCEALFLQRTIPCSSGNPVILQNGSVTMAVYVDTDGTFKTVRLT
jgi:hypothetical protein